MVSKCQCPKMHLTTLFDTNNFSNRSILRGLKTTTVDANVNFMKQMEKFSILRCSGKLGFVLLVTLVQHFASIQLD